MAVPIAALCFDKGRPITSYRLCERDDEAAFVERNRAHFREWLKISLPVVNRMNGTPENVTSGPEFEADLERLVAETSEIHFHTFTVESYRQALAPPLPTHADGALVRNTASRPTRRRQRRFYRSRRSICDLSRSSYPSRHRVSS